MCCKRFCLVAVALAVLVTDNVNAGPPQPPIITSGEWIRGDFDGDGLADEARIDWVTFHVTARTTVNFDALILESIYSGGDLNGDGELTRADGGMVLFDENENILVVHDDARRRPRRRRHRSVGTTEISTTPSRRRASTRWRFPQTASFLSGDVPWRDTSTIEFQMNRAARRSGYIRLAAGHGSRRLATHADRERRGGVQRLGRHPGHAGHSEPGRSRGLHLPLAAEPRACGCGLAVCSNRGRIGFQQ